MLPQYKSQIINVHIFDDQWTQASLPIAYGGLGVRSSLTLATSAYLASATATSDLITHIVPERVASNVDDLTEAALASWTLLIGGGDDTPTGLNTYKQSSWDSKVCSAGFHNLLAINNTPLHRARILASRARGSSDWLKAIP